jgi:hypothetical protein
VVFGHSLLGYHVKNGIMEIDPTGADVVFRIFHMYGVEKMSAAAIARTLCRQGIRTSTGNSLWSDTQVLKILKNEKYVGDLVQKKTITPDYLTHERKYNHGEESFVVIKNHHEPIVPRYLWELVQDEIRKRRRISEPNNLGHSNRYIFSGKIICGECGNVFVSRTKTRKNGTSYRRWSCRNAVTYGAVKQGAHGCDVGKLIPDELAKQMLLTAIKSLTVNQKIIHNIAETLTKASSQRAAITQKPDRIRRKLQAAADAYLSGSITIEDLEKLKTQYQQEPMKQTGINSLEIIRAAEEILCGNQSSEAFLKSMLHSIIVFKDGRVTLRLQQLSALWHFQLYLDGCHDP